MNRFFKNVLIGLVASMGLFIMIIAILEYMGIDTGLTSACKKCNCRKRTGSNRKSTRIKRHYTEISLPNE